MDLLNLNTGALANPNPNRNFTDENVLDLNPKKGQNGIYKLVGRLVPYWADPALTKFSISKILFTNPLTRDKKMLDCPSSINKPSLALTLDIMLKKREKQKLDEDVCKEIRKYFGRWTDYISPMYVYQDPQLATNNKKVKFFKFGIQFDKMIQEELKEDALISKAAINPYDLLNGKDVLISVKFKTKEYRTFEGSKFLPEVGPFKFFNPDNSVHMVTADELQQMINGVETPLSAMLKAETPSLEPYKFKPWSDADFNLAAANIKAIVKYGDLLQELLDSGKDQKMVDLIYGLMNKTTVAMPAPTANNVAAMLENTVQTMQQAPMQQAPMAQAPMAQAPMAQAPVYQATAPAPVYQAPVAAPLATAPAPVYQAPVDNIGMSAIQMPSIPVEPEIPLNTLPWANELTNAATSAVIPQQPAIAPAAQAPVYQAPVVTPPVVQAPVVQAPIATPPVAQAPIATAQVPGAPGVQFFSEESVFKNLLASL